MKKKTAEKTPLRVLCLEDEPRDAEITQELLSNAGFDLKVDCTEVEEKFVSFLRGNTYDIILSDFKLPGFDGFTALRLAKEICPQVPFICVSGTIGEEAAVELLKQGAVDYVLKDKLKRLPFVIKRALDEAKEKEQRRQVEEDLRKSEERFKLIFEYAPDAFYLCDLKGTFIAGNKAAENITGYKQEELIGGSFLKLNLLSLDQLPKAATLLAKNALGKPTGPDEFILKKRNGDTIFVEIITHPVTYEKRIVILGNARDITERKRAEEAVHASENKYRDMVEQINDVIFTTDVKGIITYISPAVEYLGGYTPEEMIGRHLTDFLDPEFIQKNVEQFHKVIAGNLRPMEYRVKVKSGEFRWVRSSSRPILKENKPIGMRGVLTDITERKQAEETLAKLNKAVETSGEAIFLTDTKGVFTYVNPGFTATYDYTATEVLGKVTPRILKSGLPGTDNYELFWKTLLSGQEVRGEHINKRKDGQLINIDGSASPILDEEKNIIGFLGIQRDITERKQAEEALRQSEERYKLMFESASIAINITRGTEIIYANPSYLMMFGLSSLDELKSCAPLELFAPEWRPQILENIQHRANNLPVPKSYEVECLRKDGGKFHVFMNMVRTTFADGPATVGFIMDITERKQAEEALRESERKYHNLYLNSSLGIFHSTIEGKFIDMNPALAWMLGYNSPEEAVECITNIAEQIYAEPQRRDDVAASTLKAGGMLTVENLYRRKDGSLWSGMLHICLATDQHGNHSIFEGFIEDITERKRAEEALLESEERFRSIYENSTIGLYRTTPDGKIILANPTLVKMLGYSSFEELAVRNLEQEGFEPSYERKQFIELIHLYGEVKGLESAWNRKDGSIIYIRESARVFHDPDGTTLYYDGSVEDITERKQAEEALIYEQNLLKSLMDYVPDQIYFKDLNSRFLRMSKSQAERFGLGDPVQAIGKTDFDFFTEDHAQEAYMHEQEIIKTGLPLVNIEEKETWPDGKETWASTTKVPLRDPNGKITGTFGVSRDITDQKKLQNQLLQTQKVQSIGTLAGGIAHDFNNILGIILAYISVLERSELNKEKVSKSTAAISQAVSRGAALVRQILTFARQTGVSMKQVNIPDLIRELLVMLKETFPPVIEFQTNIEQNISFINADQTQMHQVFLNLCVNARDAMPKGGMISVEVKTVRSETIIQQFPEVKGDRYISISVSDTGTGMDEATKGRIFDPFFTTKEQGKGTGLGLSVVYGVIHEHHGFISVESKVGQGTTFHLYIPVPQEEKNNQEIKNIKAEEQQRGTETILFVEDEPLLREVTQSALESNGYTVILATNGREAVEIYKQQNKEIALVLSDMGLPKIRGIEVYAMLKEINPHVKIIFASGFISQETRSELSNEGVKGFIQKPYSMNEVLQTVREVLNKN